MMIDLPDLATRYPQVGELSKAKTLYCFLTYDYIIGNRLCEVIIRESDFLPANTKNLSADKVRKVAHRLCCEHVEKWINESDIHRIGLIADLGADFVTDYRNFANGLNLRFTSVDLDTDLRKPMSPKPILSKLGKKLSRYLPTKWL